MGKRRKNVPFNPFSQTEVDKRIREKTKKHEEMQKAAEERAKRREQEEAILARRRQIEKEEREEKERLAEIKREKERVERENKRYRSPSLEPDFYNDLSEKKITILSRYEKLIILSIYGLRENPEEYNELGLLINYLQANFENDEEKRTELENYIRSRDTWNTNFIKGTVNSDFPRTLKQKLESLEELARYHHKNCPIRGTDLISRDDTEPCMVCEVTTEAIKLLTEAEFKE